MRHRWVIPILLVALAAAACSSDSEDSAPPAPATQTPVVQSTAPIETPTAVPTDVVDPLVPENPEDGEQTAPDRGELIDTFVRLALQDELVTRYLAEEEITCLAEQSFSVFTQQRLAELGINPSSITEAYQQPGLFVIGDVYDITDREIFELENRALGCLDWRNFVVEVLVDEGIRTEQARCIASEISVEVLRAVVSNAIVVSTGEGFGQAQAEVLAAFGACQAG